MQESRKTINISTITIFKVVGVFLALYFFYIISDILAIIFVSIILASALDPWVNWLQKRKIPRTLSMIFIYLILVLVIGSIIYLLIPPISEQISRLLENFPYYFDKLISSFSVFRDFSSEHGFLDEIKENIKSISANFQGTASGVFSTISGIFGSIFSFFLVLVITFYMVVEENAVKKIVWSIVPEKHQPYVMQLILRMQKKIGLWLRGQLILSLIIFLLTFVGLSILRVDYALTLALVAGLTEFVPYLGPLFAAVPAVFLAFTQSPILAIFVVGLYYIIQMVENNIIVPKLMQKVVGLNPVVSIVVLLIGFKVAGVVGAMLAIPVATAVNVFFQDIFERKSMK